MGTLKSTSLGITEESLVADETETIDHCVKEQTENEISTHEIEEYFERKGIDIQAGIERLWAIIQKLEARSQKSGAKS